MELGGVFKNQEKEFEPFDKQGGVKRCEILGGC